MKKYQFLKYLLGVTLLSNLNFQCACKKLENKISHLQVSIAFKQEVIYLENGRVPFTLTIKSTDELAKDLKYTCVEWLVKDRLGKIVNTSGESIDPGYALVYGDNQLYYQPQGVGNHMVEITVSDEPGSLKKKQLATILVKDHLPIDFQVAIKPEKAAAFVHEPVKLIVDISSHQKEAAQLTYQIKEISTDKKGNFSATEQGTPIGPNHDLSYGKNILYYNNIDKQAGIHDIKLVVANSKGDTQALSACLSILDTDFQVKVQLQKPAILVYEPAKLIVDITSSQVGLDKLDYQIKEISTSVEGGSFLTSAEGSQIHPGHGLSYGKNTLYYQPNQQLGIHDIKLVVTNSNGNAKTVLASLQVLDIDFQVKLKPEKPTIFFYEQAPMKIEITSPQEGGDKLSYQIQELSTNKKGYFSLTAEGEPIGEKQMLSYGRSELYYHPKEQLGTHDIKLVITNSNGNTKTVLTSLQVIDIDFQLEIKPEKTQSFSHDIIKLVVDISSKQESCQQLNYQLKEVNTNIEAGQLSLTPQGSPLVLGQALQYGKNVWYYTPHQPGNHKIQVVVANHGIIKEATAVLTANQATFLAEVKIENPAKSAATTWEVGLLLESNSGLKGEKWELSSWQIEEPEVGKLQDLDGYQVAERAVLLQPGLNKFKLVFSEEIALNNVPQLKLTIHQPNGKVKLLVVDLSKYVFSYLEKDIGLLIEQYDVTYQKLGNKEPFAQDKFDRVNQQLETLRSNLNILAQSTTINQDQLENALAKIDPKKLALKAFFKRQ